MGFKLSSFLLGATTAAADTLEEDRASAAKSASLGVKALKENYDKVMLENRTLENKVTKNMEVLKTFDSTATDAQLFAAATNDTYMNMAVEAARANPASFKVGDVVQIKEDNASKLTATEMLKAYTTIPSVSKAARQAEESSGNFVSDIRKRVASSAASKAEEQTARAMGVSIEQLRGASEFKRPAFDTGAEFDMAKFQKQPSNSKEILDALDVKEIQTAKQFGKDSPEARAIKEQKDFVKSFEQKADSSAEARANRLMVEALDSKDPARIKEINKDLAATRASIINHKKLTSIADPKEKEATYTAMRGDVSDYVNTRMRDVKGTKWRSMVDFKTYTDEATGKTIVSKVNKAEMSVEQQQEMFAFERKLTAQALRDNGYTLPDGTPRTPVAERLMRNFNISAADLAAPSTTPTQPAPVAAPTTTPARPATSAKPELTREDQDALVWANTPANAGPKADAIKKKIQNKINGVN